MTESPATDPLLPGPLWLVGCGNMAGAMLDGWIAAGVDPARISVVRPSGKSVGHGIRVGTAFPEGQVPAIVLLGMKPHQLGEVVPALAPILDPNTILVSILAGTEAAVLRELFPVPGTIVKAMPNLPVRLGKGVVPLYSDSTDIESRALATGLMAALGHAEWFDDEDLFQAAGILTGAGPAFLYRFIDAFARAGESLGLGHGRAVRLATAMADGAGALAAASSDGPAELARKVASPRGTTEAGLAVLDDDDALIDLARRTLAASRRRSIEMAAEARAR